MLRSLILWFGLVASAQVMQIGILTVPVSGPPAAATPTFSPSAGTYSSAQTVTISTSTSGCSGYLVYNTTGASSGGNLTGTTAYSTPVSVSTTSTLYAQVQSCPSYTNSGIGSAAYTIILGPTLVQSCAATGLVCTFGSAITAGNQLYLCLNYANSGSTTWSGDSGTFTPDPGNGTAITNIQYYGASDGRLTCIYVPTTGGGGTAITASNSGSFPAIVGLEVHNGTFDKSDNGVSAG